MLLFFVLTRRRRMMELLWAVVFAQKIVELRQGGWRGRCQTWGLHSHMRLVHCPWRVKEAWHVVQGASRLPRSKLEQFSCLWWVVLCLAPLA